MNTTKSKRKITLITFTIFFTIISIIALLVSMNSTRAENLAGEHYDTPLLPFIRTASITEIFKDDRVEIILRHRYSQITEINLNVFNQAVGERFESIMDMRNVAVRSNTALTLRPRRHQLLSLQLKEPCKQNVLDAIVELKQMDKVLLAQTIDLEGIIGFSVSNDTHEQWGLREPILRDVGGQLMLDRTGIGVEGAWNITRGSQDVLVGVMEMVPIDGSHPDLEGRVICAFEPFVDNLDQRHATHVAGIIGAIANNNMGIDGVAQVSLVSLNGRPQYFVQSLALAEDMGIRIINASIGFVVPFRILPPNPLHYAAIADFDGIIVAAAGNYGRNIDADNERGVTRPFPAAFSSPNKSFPYFEPLLNVISIGSLRISTHHEWGHVCYDSNYGEESVQIFAPGRNIISTVPKHRCENAFQVMRDGEVRWSCEWNVAFVDYETQTISEYARTPIGVRHISNGYHEKIGTSMAAPHVSGVAALMLTVNSTLSGEQLREALIATSDNFTVFNQRPGDNDPLYYIGRSLNAYRAVESVNPFVTNIICDGTIEITGLNRQLSGNLVIPDKLFGRYVTNLGDNIFVGQGGLRSVTIPKGMTTIQNHLFSSSNFHSRIPNLERIVVHEGVVQIGNWGFRNKPNLTIHAASQQQTNNWGTFSQWNPDGVPIVFTDTGQALVNGMWFEKYDEGVKLMGGLQSSLQSLPETVSLAFGERRAAYNVVGINSGVFAGTNLTSITMHRNIRFIGENAFQNARNLTSVAFAPDSRLQTIGSGAFEGTNITSIAIPRRVSTIGSNAFPFGMNIVLEEGRESVQRELFQHQNDFVSITIPSSVQSIDNNAFDNMRYLVSIVAAGNERYFSQDGILYRLGTATQFVHIPARISGNIRIPERVHSISENAFAGTDITEVTIPMSVRIIEDGAFENARNLTVVVIMPESELQTIGEKAFFGTSIENIIIPTSILDINRDIGRDAFPWQTTVEWVDNFVFQGNTFVRYLERGETSFVVPSMVAGRAMTTIGEGAFQNAGLGRVIIRFQPHIEVNAFCGWSGRTIELWGFNDIPSLFHENWLGASEGVILVFDWFTATSCGMFLNFHNTGEVEYFLIPDFITEIYYGAFENSKVISVTIPASVAFIGKRAFANSHLETVVLRHRNQNSIQKEADSFEGTNLKSVMFHSWNSFLNFREAWQWEQFWDIMTLVPHLRMVTGGGVSPPAEWYGIVTDETIRVAVSTDVSNFDFFAIEQTNDSKMIAALLFDRLVDINPDVDLDDADICHFMGHVVPNLAVEWWLEESDDGVGWMFELRQEVYFHNWNYFNAWSIYNLVRFVQDYHQNSPAYVVWRHVNEVVVLDTYLVKLSLEEHYSYFLELLATPFAGIAEGLFDNCCCCWCCGVNTFSGTGSFFIDDAASENHLILTRFDEHFRGTPPTKSFHFLAIPDYGHRAALLEMWEVDIALDLLSNDIEWIINLEHLNIINFDDNVLNNSSLNASNTSFLQFNMNNPVTNCPLFRSAIAHAIDREELASVFYGVSSEDNLWGMRLLSYQNISRREFNRDIAMGLLSNAGYMGETLSLLVPYENSSLVTKAWFIHQMLADVGVLVELNFVHQPLIYEYLENGEFDIFLNSMHSNNLFLLYHVFVGDRALNHGGFHIEEINYLFAKAFSEFDPVARQGYLFQIQYILSQYLPTLSLIHQSRFTATNNSIQGISTSACGSILNLSGTRVDL